MDLQKFCDNTGYRNKLSKPWSAGNYTYASNGHILIRVPRRAEIAEPKEPIGLSALQPFFDREPATYSPIPEVHPEKETCNVCRGKKKIRYQGEMVPCEECEGEGEWNKHVSVGIGDSFFSDVYLSWIAELPNAVIGTFNRLDPARFKFDGGEGLLMPRRN